MRAGELREAFEVAAVACALGDRPAVPSGWSNDVGEKVERVAAQLRAADGSPFVFAGASLRPERFRPIAEYDSDDELRAVWRVRTFWSELGLRLDRPRSRGIAFALCRRVAGIEVAVPAVADPLAVEHGAGVDDLPAAPDYAVFTQLWQSGSRPPLRSLRHRAHPLLVVRQLSSSVPRGMSAAQKVQQVRHLTRTCRQFSLAGIRARHPTASEREVRIRLASFWSDRDTMIRLFDWDPDVRGIG